MRQRPLFGLFVLLAVLFGIGCDNSQSPGSGEYDSSEPYDDGFSEPAPANAIELVFPYGSEKKEWVREVTRDFNNAQMTIGSGRPIFVKPIAMGSGELTRDVLDGVVQAHLVSPASGAFVELGNAESQAKTGGPLMGKTQNLVLSPVVIAMWEPMAKALGWPDKPVGWAEVIDLANSDEGWAKYNMPQWGKFKFGHTHPEYSNSGLISLLAETYAGAGKTRGLTMEDLARPEVATFLRDIEQSVVHYGRSTGFFGDKLFANGPSYLSAAVLYENMVIKSYDDTSLDLPFPVVAIYPKEGTFWSDHPVGVIERPWVSDEHREAAGVYIDYLMEETQQRAALRFGFRPGDPSIPLGAPIDARHGVDPDMPQTTLEVPPANVMQGVIDLWKVNKKNASITLVIDVSGSMRGEPLRGAKAGAVQFIEMLGERDKLSILSFSDQPIWVARDKEVGPNRQQLKAQVNSLIAGGGTALYDSITQAHRHMGGAGDSKTINAVVVLTDGADTQSSTSLRDLLNQVKADNEQKPIRVFPIGYGDGAEVNVLKQIAEQTQTKAFTGSTETIRDVFRDIATFF